MGKPIQSRPRRGTLAGRIYDIPKGKFIFFENTTQRLIYGAINNSRHLKCKDFKTTKFIAVKCQDARDICEIVKVERKP